MFCCCCCCWRLYVIHLSVCCSNSQSSQSFRCYFSLSMCSSLPNYCQCVVNFTITSLPPNGLLSVGSKSRSSHFLEIILLNCGHFAATFWSVDVVFSHIMVNHCYFSSSSWLNTMSVSCYCDPLKVRWFLYVNLSSFYSDLPGGCISFWYFTFYSLTCFKNP